MLVPHWVGWTHPSFYIIFMFLVYVSKLILMFVPPSSLLFGMSCLSPRCLLLICFRVLHYYTILSKVWVLYNVTRIMNPCFVFIWWRYILKVYKMLCILYFFFIVIENIINNTPPLRRWGLLRKITWKIIKH